jgi:hypothetical protein
MPGCQPQNMTPGASKMFLPSVIQSNVKSHADTLRKNAKFFRGNLEFVISND